MLLMKRRNTNQDEKKEMHCVLERRRTASVFLFSCQVMQRRLQDRSLMQINFIQMLKLKPQKREIIVFLLAVRSGIPAFSSVFVCAVN